MKTILLIENNAAILDNFQEYLEMEHYTVIAAKNGEKGIELAQKFLPNLIICDVLMPEMDGRRVLSLMKDSFEISDIPFVFSSSLTEQFNRAVALAMGADDYMLKPFSFETLLKTTKDCIKAGDRRRKSLRNACR